MNDKAANRSVGIWLLTGVIMILIQVMLGGITRLTGSGLSITEWDLIPGIIPPFNEAQWQEEFRKYQQTTQYELLNNDMTLSGFKNIFLWEYLHRLWARLFVPAFLIPLIYFLWKRMISTRLLIRLGIVFILGALQGVVGWIMVLSGLADRPWVDAVKLSLHLILALVLLSYLFWITLEELRIPAEISSATRLRPFLVVIIALLSVQLFYGGLMAGTHAALFYPTFPKIGSQWIPGDLFSISPPTENFIENTGMIQLIHRSLGYLIAALVIVFFVMARRHALSTAYNRALLVFPMLIILQVLLGILTLLNSLGSIPLIPAVAHQFCASLILLNGLLLFYMISQTNSLQETEKSASEKTTVLDQAMS